MAALDGKSFGLRFLRCVGILLLLGSISTVDAISKCHSCFRGCQNIDECDCTPSTETCEGDYCYVKLDRLTDSGLGAVRKGCVNWAPEEYVDVCQYVTNNNTIECYCKGDSCNTKDHFKNYEVEPLPLVSCCECEGYNYENGTIDCLPDSCLRNCTGHYCYNDIVRQSQGCGWGYSLAWQFLRNPSAADRPKRRNSTGSLPWPWSQDDGDMTCTEAYADMKTILRGCTCGDDFCNVQSIANYYTKNVTEKTETADQYCYAVHAVSNKPITGDVYRQSTTCPGHYCFVSMTTTVLAYGAHSANASSWDGQRIFNSTDIEDDDSLPELQTQYELTAGCMLVDDEKKVDTGCTAEWSETDQKPTRKHCICTGHICNYIHLITGEDRKSLLAFDWKTSKDYHTVTSSATKLRWSVIWTGIIALLSVGL